MNERINKQQDLNSPTCLVSQVEICIGEAHVKDK